VASVPGGAVKVALKSAETNEEVSVSINGAIELIAQRRRRRRRVSQHPAPF
jgi:hypothetical protein